MQKRSVIILVVTTLALGACTNLRFPGVYRVDIPQGNFVTEDMLEQLQPGMTREQVRYVMGVPTLTDPFTPDTWYYLMTYQPGRGEYVEQQIVVFFDGDTYRHHEGEVIDDFRARVSGQQERELQERVESRTRQDPAGPPQPQPPGQEPTPSPMPTPGQTEPTPTPVPY